MCIIFNSEVILANILVNTTDHYGIDMDDIAKYCVEVKNNIASLSKTPQYVYFDLNTQSISEAINIYNNHFVEIGDKIYRYKTFNVDYFNSRFPKVISTALKDASHKYVESLQ
jgi:hypothetical protein